MGRTGKDRIGPRYFVSEPAVAVMIEDVSDFDGVIGALRRVYPDLRETDRAEYEAVERIGDLSLTPDSETEPSAPGEG